VLARACAAPAQILGNAIAPEKRLARKTNYTEPTMYRPNKKSTSTTVNSSIVQMEQPDAAWTAAFAREHGRAPAALAGAKLGEVRANSQQEYQQQLEAATAQHQEQVAYNQQQQQELVAVHQELEAKNQELVVCKKALADVRAILDAVQAPAAVQQPVLNDVNDEPAAAAAAAAAAGDDDADDDEPAAAVHEAPEAAQPPAKRARVDKATPVSYLCITIIVNFIYADATCMSYHCSVYRNSLKHTMRCSRTCPNMTTKVLVKFLMLSVRLTR
jgi:hypothetical protein